MSVALNAALQRLVWERAESLFEYCHAPVPKDTSPFCIDHVTALKHHGSSDEQNLALTCFDCNSYKASNIAGLDLITGQVTRLFHPRRDRWKAHFSRNGAELEGMDDVGRTTIDVLRINDPDRVALRRDWIELGWMRTD